VDKRLISPILAAIFLALLVNSAISFMEVQVAHFEKSALALRSEEKASSEAPAMEVTKTVTTIVTPSTTVTRSEASLKTEMLKGGESAGFEVHELFSSLLVNVAISLAVALAVVSAFRSKITYAKR